MDRYEEALERAKMILCNLPEGSDSARDIETIFPELKESEDERIKKWLIDYFDRVNDEVVKEDRLKIITYLKKQSTPQIRTGLEWANAIDSACDKLYLEEYSHGEHCHKQSFKWGFQEGINWLEKQKDVSKAIEAVDKIDKYINEHLANAHDMKDSNPDKKYYRGWDDALGEMAGILQDVYSDEKQKEQPKHHDFDDVDPNHLVYSHYTKVRETKTGRVFWAEYSREAAEWYEADTGKAYSISDVEIVKEQKAQPKEELVYHLNGLMQDYIKESKDKEEKEHRFKCYQLFWDALEDAEFFEQKEQKPADEQFPPLEGLDAIKAKYYDDGFKNGFDDGVASVKPAEWSDSVAKEMFIKALERAVEQTKKGYELTDCDKHSWWEDFKAYSEIKPTECSEEDEALIENVCTALKGYALHERKVDLDEHAHRLEEMSERLKSLRPQPHWKPSEEQMEALKYAIEILGCMKAANTLRELSIDLKKL